MKNLLSSFLLVSIIFIIPGIGLYMAMNNIYGPFGYLASLAVSIILWFSLRKKFEWKIDQKTKQLHSW